MKIGEYIYARTHADFLNELLGTNYKAWMKSCRSLPDGKQIWMIELGYFVTPAGWRNQLTEKGISEKHMGSEYAFEGHETYVGAMLRGKTWDDSDRVVFDIVKSGGYRRYIFRGVFRINREKSTLYENVWDLISEEYRF